MKFQDFGIQRLVKVILQFLHSRLKKKDNQHTHNICTASSPCWNWDYFKSCQLKLKYLKETCSHSKTKIPGNDATSTVSKGIDIWKPILIFPGQKLRPEVMTNYQLFVPVWGTEFSLFSSRNTQKEVRIIWTEDFFCQEFCKPCTFFLLVAFLYIFE